MPIVGEVQLKSSAEVVVGPAYATTLSILAYSNPSAPRHHPGNLAQNPRCYLQQQPVSIRPHPQRCQCENAVCSASSEVPRIVRRQITRSFPCSRNIQVDIRVNGMERVCHSHRHSTCQRFSSPQQTLWILSAGTTRLRRPAGKVRRPTLQ